MSQIAQVKEASNIVEIINERVPLSRSGANFRACCPFHSEKTPSFFVNDALQRYRCFGCGASGDVIGFLQQYETLSFAEALRYLADRAGITLQEFTKTNEDLKRERQLEILNLAKEYYSYLLTEHPLGEKARTYLKDRKVSSQSVKIFQIGYALPSWDGLIKFLHGKKKYALADLEQAGLVIQGQGGRYYDRFRDRVVFPLRNHRGQVLGFSGRTLSADQKEAKYINSPETLLYHKSEMLFGLSELAQAIKQAKQVLVVEGEFDVISSAQAHVNHIVAIKGSALTEPQAKLLERYVEKVILSLDADEAGINATLKAIQVVSRYNLELRVIDFAAKERSFQKDPDEIARENPKLWRSLAAQTVSVYEFLLQAACRKFDPASPEGKRQIIDFLAPVYGHITHVVEQDFYVQKLAQLLQVKPDLVMSDITRFQHSGGKKFTGDGVGKTPKSQTVAGSQAPVKVSRRSQLETTLLGLCLAATTGRPNKIKQLTSIPLITPGANQVMGLLAKHADFADLHQVTQGWPSDLVAQVFDWLYDPAHALNQSEADWQLLFSELKKTIVQDQLQVLNQQIAHLDALSEKTSEQEAQLAQLLKDMVVLQSQLRG